MIVAFVNPDRTLLHEEPSDDQLRLSSNLSTLLRDAELIPVSGLDEEGLLTIPAAFTSWQVLLHGAVVVTPEGMEDPAWRRLTLETQAAAAEALMMAGQAAQHVNALNQLNLDVTLTERNGRPLLVTLRHPHALELAINQAQAMLTDWLRDGPFRLHLRLTRTPSELTLLPRDLRPELAVNYLLGQLSPELTVGLSAHPDDAAFLNLCDYALVPGQSTLLGSPQDNEDA
ncbi:hypothetical protein LAJ19_19245 (plasmid) [Deinococcus taeanensis]|uniref:hypothetical protein n=1 Tax=Deinococcus taeanensis TaxID=2737050 RepID=UPI001CDC9485|nr:hypothetical protein [Deinococcus taeanensis]UBV44925.1 hypothetical protein LAJ19_19245 [Deinococcus taeanensis]